jgi:DNA/RNA endonuclease G (NUC1)
MWKNFTFRFSVPFSGSLLLLNLHLIFSIESSCTEANNDDNIQLSSFLMRQYNKEEIVINSFLQGYPKGKQSSFIVVYNPIIKSPHYVIENLVREDFVCDNKHSMKKRPVFFVDNNITNTAFQVRFLIFLSD